MFAAAAVVAMVDLGVKVWAQAVVPPTGIEAGPVDLRLGYNPGVAFSLAAAVPPGVVLTVTAVVTAGVAAVVYRAAPSGSRLQMTAFAAVLGGAVANLTDRAVDGVVTDYLHSGGWPTFNRADAAIVVGAVLLVLSNVVRNGPVRTDGPAVARGARR
ncbi:signal peptidase II [Terrabacter sp. NPDC000476]|uniref:signal peptidase II n=1 Tax=Terrabacter sp. NPDC000476 TaxID=3154258 RepID=UPI00332D4D32